MSHETFELNPLIGQARSRDLTLAVLSPAFANATLSEEASDVLFEKVERAKQEWEATVDSLPELVFVVDDRGCIVRANRTLEAWHLGSVKTVQGLGLHTVLHADCTDPACSLNHYVQQIAVALNNHQVDQFETYDVVLQRQLLIRLQPVTPQRPNLPITAVIVIEDITERRRNEQALRRSLTRLAAMSEIQRSILAAGSPEEIAEAALTRIRPLVSFRQARLALCNSNDDDLIVLIADANGATHLRPSRACTQTELQFGAAHRLIDDFTVEDLQPRNGLSPLEQQLFSEGIRSFANVPLVADGTFIGALLLASDRVAAFKAEQLEVVREIGNLLAIAVHQARLYRQLQHINTQLRSALRVKEELLQNVSHELRTPIGLIFGYTSLINEGELGAVTPEQQQAFGVMLKQEEQLRFMIERLVDLRGNPAAQLYRLPLDVEEWLALVARPWQQRANAHAHVIHIDLDLPDPAPKPLADPEALKQVLDNLLDNAIKFSPRNTEIRLHAQIDRGAVLITVRDQGIGFAPDQRTQLFEKFYQVDSSSKRRYGGMGIGLALCRDIIAAHGGQIWAESAGENQGSAFCFALPLE